MVQHYLYYSSIISRLSYNIPRIYYLRVLRDDDDDEEVIMQIIHLYSRYIILESGSADTKYFPAKAITLFTHIMCRYLAIYAAI